MKMTHRKFVNSVDVFMAFATPVGDCLEWSLTIGDVGYGICRGGRTHRRSWELHNGPIPSGLLVCHRCDNRKCVRPEHLFLGSRLDNNRDMWAKGRGRPLAPQKGATHPRAKLTENNVYEIRARRDDGEALISIAKSFGIDMSMVSLIALRKSWKSLPEEVSARVCGSTMAIEVER